MLYNNTIRHTVTRHNKLLSAYGIYAYVYAILSPQSLFNEL